MKVHPLEPGGKGHKAQPPGHGGPPSDLYFDENFGVFSNLEDSESFQKQTHHEFSTEGSGPSDGGEGHKLPPGHGGPPHS
ncbi:hypothetical protein AHAS_Ahas06G0054300 [Arachis hypogaea]